LLRHRDKVVTQEQLVHEVWGAAYDGDFEGLQGFPGIGYLLQTSPGVHAAVTS
jgi:hypothetical protein